MMASSNSATNIHQTRKKRDKGKGAFSTENRRLTWDLVVWPLLISLNRPYFTLEELRRKSREICKMYKVNRSNIRGGLVSLTYKGFIVKDHHNYSISFKLVPFLNRGVDLDYGMAYRKIVAR